MKFEVGDLVIVSMCDKYNYYTVYKELNTYKEYREMSLKKDINNINFVFSIFKIEEKFLFLKIPTIFLDNKKIEHYWNGSDRFVIVLCDDVKKFEDILCLKCKFLCNQNCTRIGKI